jgi:MFS family permease
LRTARISENQPLMSPEPTDQPADQRRFRSLASVFGLLYFIQGICEPTEGLIAQPLRSVLRDRGYSPSHVGLFAAAISLPWTIKPLYGLLTDFVPFLGMRRRSYLLAANAVAAFGLITIGAIPLDAWGVVALTGALLLPTIAIAFGDVVVDALMVEEGQPRGWTGALQSVQWGAIYAAAILTGVFGGWLSEANHERAGFLICGGLAFLALAVAGANMREPAPPVTESDPASDAPAPPRPSLLSIFDRRFTAIAAFLFLWNFNPLASNVLQEFMVREQGWTETFYGETMSWMAAGCVAGSVLYGRLSARFSPRGLFHTSILLGVASSLVYGLMTSPNSARAISFASGCVYMFGNLAQLDLAARMCSPATAATAFATLMAISNLGLAGSSAVGGILYERLAASQSAIAAFRWLVCLGALSTAACWLLTPWFRLRPAQDLLREGDRTPGDVAPPG